MFLIDTIFFYNISRLDGSKSTWRRGPPKPVKENLKNEVNNLSEREKTPASQITFWHLNIEMFNATDRECLSEALLITLHVSSLFPVGYQRSLIDNSKIEAFVLVLTCYPSLTCLKAIRCWWLSSDTSHLSPSASPAVFGGNVLRFHLLTCRQSVTFSRGTASAASELKYFTISTQS